MKKTKEAHEKLLKVLKSEIKIRQKILGNIQHIEYILQNNDPIIIEELKDQNTYFFKILKEVQKKRSFFIKQLFPTIKNEFTLDNTLALLDPTSTSHTEIFVLINHALELRNKISNLNNRLKNQQTDSYGGKDKSKCLMDNPSGAKRNLTQVITIESKKSYFD